MKYAMIQEKLVGAEYDAAGKPYKILTRPYFSTDTITFQVVPGALNNATPAQISCGYLVAAQGQQCSFFEYGQDQGVKPDDTNISKARQTIAGEDFVIRAVALSHVRNMPRFSRSIRARRSSTRFPQAVLNNPIIADAFSGGGADNNGGIVYDPQGLHVPLVVDSPLNLHDALMQRLAPAMNIQMVWGQSTLDQIGTLDWMPQGSASSVLLAHGMPTAANARVFHEGFVWRKSTSEKDSDLLITATLQHNLVIPFTPVIFPSQAGLDAADTLEVLPTSVDVRLRLYLGGVAFYQPSRN